MIPLGVVAQRWLMVHLAWAILLSVGCAGDTYEDITDIGRQYLLDRCVEMTQPLLLVRVASGENRLSALGTHLVLATPESSYAPFTVLQYSEGRVEPRPDAEVIQLVDPGTRLTGRRLVKEDAGLSGLYLLPLATLEDGTERSVFVPRLVSHEWSRALKDGLVSESERLGLGGISVLDSTYFRFCPAR